MFKVMKSLKCMLILLAEASEAFSTNCLDLIKRVNIQITPAVYTRVAYSAKEWISKDGMFRSQ